ncbi:MAG: inorganic phosphate transporter, partial [Candidatus Gracilibacteria bacterium]
MDFLPKKNGNYKIEILAISVLFIISRIFIYGGGNGNFYLLLAGILGLFMAINIGANDVANNMGPAVGSKAIGLTGAIIIAAIFEASGVMVAGGEVVNTIKKGIINPELIQDTTQFIVIMMATLSGAAFWVSTATYFKAPVSTTHSIVGGLVGAGLT